MSWWDQAAVEDDASSLGVNWSVPPMEPGAWRSEAALNTGPKGQAPRAFTADLVTLDSAGLEWSVGRPLGGPGLGYREAPGVAAEGLRLPLTSVFRGWAL